MFPADDGNEPQQEQDGPAERVEQKRHDRHERLPGDAVRAPVCGKTRGRDEHGDRWPGLLSIDMRDVDHQPPAA